MNSNRLRIGGHDDFPFFFNGAIDDILIFNGVLGSVEVQQLYLATMQNDGEQVTICHKPGTPAQKTLEIPIQALAGHLVHDDQIGACDVK